MTWKRLFLLFFVCCALLLAAVPAWCMQARPIAPITRESSEIPLKVRIDGSYLWGKSFERVYVLEGMKISDLTWTLEQVYMLGGVISAEPLPWLQANFGIWAAVNYGNGKMDDYDWEYKPAVREWTDWSHHRIKLKRGLMLDANVQARFLEYAGLGLWGMAGFKHQNWYWKDKGKFYVYSSDNEFRNQSGSFNDMHGINYQQWFYAPYAGLSVTFDYNALHLSAYAAYTPLAWANDEDYHLLRNLNYKGHFENINYSSFGVQASWDITDNLLIAAAFDFQQYLNRLGDVDMSTGETLHKGGSVAHFSHMITLSLGWRF